MPVAITIVLAIASYYYIYKKPEIGLSIILFSLPTFLFRWTFAGMSFNSLDIIIVGSFLIWFGLDPAKFGVRSMVIWCPCGGHSRSVASS